MSPPQTTTKTKQVEYSLSTAIPFSEYRCTTSLRPRLNAYKLMPCQNQRNNVRHPPARAAHRPRPCPPRLARMDATARYVPDRMQRRVLAFPPWSPPIRTL